MHLVQALAPDCFGALDFIDKNGNPIEKTFRIRAASNEIPPTGKIAKPCVWFEGSDRKCFLPSTQSKLLAAILKAYDLDMWKGADVTITSGPKLLKGKPTLGMVIVKASYPAGNGPAKPEITPQTENRWNQAKAAYVRDGDLDLVLQHATMSEANIARLVEECKA